MMLPKPLTLGLAPVPLAIVQQVTSLVFDKVVARHPGLFDRLGEFADRRFGIVPTDLPFGFTISPRQGTITVLRPDAMTQQDATISGPFFLLLALLEGRLDGDALFFSRALQFSGDTEAVLALRNALDDNRFDLPTDIAAMAGPFGGPVKRVLERVRGAVLERSETTWN